MIVVGLVRSTGAEISVLRASEKGDKPPSHFKLLNKGSKIFGFLSVEDIVFVP